MSYMKGKIFKVVKKSEAWRITGKAPISTKWVDTDKTHGIGVPVIRSRWMARDIKDPKEKDREDLFSATPATRDDEIHHVEAGYTQERWQRMEKHVPRHKESAYNTVMRAGCVLGPARISVLWKMTSAAS